MGWACAYQHSAKPVTSLQVKEKDAQLKLHLKKKENSKKTMNLKDLFIMAFKNPLLSTLELG